MVVMVESYSGTLSSPLPTLEMYGQHFELILPAYIDIVADSAYQSVSATQDPKRGAAVGGSEESHQAVRIACFSFSPVSN